MISAKELRTLLEQVPSGAVLRVACNGACFYIAADGIDITPSLDDAAFRVVGRLGESADSLAPGAVLVRPKRVDFIQVLPG